jgi:hypothetical protein
MTTNSENFESAKKTPAGLVLLAWLFVGIPLIWGVSQTFHNAMALFKASPPPGNAVPLVSGPSTTQPRIAPPTAP